MKQVATVWTIIAGLLLARQGWGQETDSLFFRPDSIQTLPVSLEKGARSGVEQQRVTAEPFMKARIHFTSEFIRRFNDLGADNIPTLANRQAERQLRIRSLFDADDSRLNRKGTSSQRAYAELVDQFIDDVCGATRMLTEPNENMYAEVLVRVTWQQREHSLKLYLKKSQTGSAWSWTVIGAEADFLTPDADTSFLQLAQRDTSVFIPPNAHELNFMGFAKQLRAGCELGQFVQTTAVTRAQLAAIARNLATGQLRLQTLQTTTIWLNTQLGWLLQLRQFNRETDNSGWLISDLCRSGEATCLPPVLRCYLNEKDAFHKPCD